MLDEYLFQPDADEKEHIIATYYVKSQQLYEAVKAIAIGQSIGNPNVRTQRDSPKILKENLAKILDIKSNLKARHNAVVKLAYPIVNWDAEEDGVTHLLTTLMGGQMDIDMIQSCKLLDVDIPEKFLKGFKGAKFGMDNIQKRMKAKGRPILGSIVKPKTGLTVPQLKEMIKELLEGGVDFIKEDEILANPVFCRYNERIEVISNMVNDYCDDVGREIFYTPCINGDYPYFIDRALHANEIGVRAVHLNIWAGMSAYKALRDCDMKNTAIFFQKSGDKVWTDIEHRFHIDWKVICKLARYIGADFIHAGMWGGYSSYSKNNMTEILNALRGSFNSYKKTIPSLSCGSHAGLVNTTVKTFGTELMMNVGGAIQGHPRGTTAGAKAMRQAMDCVQKGEDIKEYMKTKPELKIAIEKWGYVDE